MANILSTLQSLVKEKVNVKRREQELLSTLNRVLPSFGYKIVPTERNGERSTTPRPAAARSLQCPHCERKFAQPLHLGRHVAATHRREREKASRPAVSRNKSARGRTKKAA